MSSQNEAFWDYGAIIRRELGVLGSGIWREIGGVEMITPPQDQVEKDEVTVHGGGRVKQYMPTLIEPGLVESVIIFDPYNDDHIRLFRDLKTGRARRTQIILAAGGGTLSARSFVEKAHFEEFSKTKAMRIRSAFQSCNGWDFKAGDSA